MQVKGLLLTVFATFMFGCQVRQESKNEASYGKGVESLSDQDKEKIKGLVAKLFKDPDLCTTPTPRYKQYLEYQNKRVEIVGKANAAATDAETIKYTQQLQLLDKDYRLFNSGFETTIEQANSLANVMFANESDFQKVKDLHAFGYEVWFKDSTELTNQFNSTSDIKLKQTLNLKLNLLNQTFKLRYFGLLGLK